MTHDPSTRTTDELVEELLPLLREFTARDIEARHYLLLSQLLTVQKGNRDAALETIASVVRMSATCTSSQTAEAGIPEVLHQGIVRGIAEAFDTFIADTADDDDAAVRDMHEAAVKVRSLFDMIVGDVEPANGGAA